MRAQAQVLQEKVERLLSLMTLEEKVAQMIQVPYSKVSKEEAFLWAGRGVGSFLHVLGDEARALQTAALNTRLGIPMLFGIDAIHGHGLNDHATIFPSQLAVACTWDVALVREMGEVTAREVATDGLHWTFSPVLCLGRDARWGRIDETFGEDPCLAGELGAAIIRGYQGDSTEGPESILACAKHYIGYGEAVGARDACDTPVTFRKMREVFLPPFQKAIQAGCATFMTAYGAIDGTPFTASRKALHTILREELGFDGFVVTDWDNVTSLVTRQKVAADLSEASAMAARAGNDMIMVTTAFYDEVLRLIAEGKLAEALIEDAVRHILTVKFRMGLFEHPEKKGRPGCLGCPEHLDAALRAARESVVLLSNRDILPLGKNVRKIAVIGPNADDIRAQYGDWTYFTHPEPNPEHEPVRPFCTLWEGVRQLASQNGLEAVYHQGCSVLPQDSDDIAGAVAIAEDADVIVLALGDSVALHGETRDRADLALSGRQTALFEALSVQGKPIVTVLIASKPLCLGVVAERSDAVITAFHGGMFGGQAVAEVIFGTLNPSGRLPISFPRHSGQIPVYYNYLPGWHGDAYVDMPETPLFTFGEGLSFTSYRYANLTFDPLRFVLRVEVTNTGLAAGDEVVQAYRQDVVASVMQPVKQLIAFQRVRLEPGETKQVVFHLTTEMLSLITPDERRITEPGEFLLMAGHSAKAEDLLTVSFTFEGNSSPALPLQLG